MKSSSFIKQLAEGFQRKEKSKTKNGPLELTVQFEFFENLPPFAVILQSDDFNDVFISDIGDCAVELFNSKFKTNFDYKNLRYFIVNDYSNSIYETTIESGFHFNFKTDIVIRPESYPRTKSEFIPKELNMDEVVSSINLAVQLYNNGQIKVAENIFWNIDIHGISFLVQMAKLENDKNTIAGLECLLMGKYPKKKEYIQKLFKVYTPASFDQALEKLENPKVLLKLDRERLIKYVSKTQPYIAMRICIRFQEYLEFLPIPCKSEEIMSAFIKICLEYNYSNAMLVYLSEIFVKYGQIDHALMLGYSASVLADCPEYVVRRVCWILLVDRHFADLYLLLVSYFNKDPNRSIGGLTAYTILRYLSDIKKYPSNRPKNIPRVIQTIVDPLDPEELDFLCIILDTASFLFLNGNIDECIEICTTINPQNRKFFEKTGIPPEFDLYVYIEKASELAAFKFSKIDAVFALGDESSLNIAYRTLPNFDMIISHPIPRLAIWDLRSGNKKFIKSAFWNQIQNAGLYRQIILCLGHFDLLYVIPKLLQFNISVLNFADVIKKIIEIYKYVLKKIHQKLPHLGIFIHPIKAENRDLIQQQRIFNQMLEKSIPDYVTIIPEENCFSSYDDSSCIPIRSLR